MKQYMKAITGSIVTGLGSLQIAYVDNTITSQEWVTIAIATVVSLGAIWAVPNVTTATRKYKARKAVTKVQEKK